jgi:hypothetical protein
MRVQARIPAALAAIHNFIRIYDPQDEIFQISGELERDGVSGEHIVANPAEYFSTHISPQERKRAEAKRDSIAQACWVQYQEYLSANPGVTHNIEHM